MFVGLDDTDIVDSPGTNQLAREIAARLRNRYFTRLILRHQLLDDPRVPYTSQNGSASLVLEPLSGHDGHELLAELSAIIRAWSPVGSDPGLCVARQVSPAVQEFGRLCQRELVTQQQARSLAAAQGLELIGLGGTEGGVIGALAAVGLASTGNEGRVIYSGVAHEDYYHVQGEVSIAELRRLGVDEVIDTATGNAVEAGLVCIAKRLRPNYRRERIVLFVARSTTNAHGYETVKVK